MRALMQRRRPTWLGLVVIAVLLTPAAPSREAAGQPAPPTVTYAVQFLPSLFAQVCPGDTVALHAWVSMNDPFAGGGGADPLAPGLPIVPLVAPVSVTAPLGSIVPPSAVVRGGAGQVLSFTYTAARPGTEIVSLIVGAGQGAAQKTLTVLPSCDYDVSFFLTAGEQGAGASFNEVFEGEGTFTVNRMAAGAMLTGQGTDRSTLLLSGGGNGMTCTSAPVLGDGTFTVRGSVAPPPSDVLEVGLEFSPIHLPMPRFTCRVMGLSITVPTPSAAGGDAPGDPNEIGLPPLLFPGAGGSAEVSINHYSGVIDVEPR